MMGAMHIEGIPALEWRLAKLRGRTGELVEAGSMAAARVIRDEARAIAPRSAETPPHGHLADHIGMEVVQRTAAGCVVHIGPDERHFHGRFVENGTSKMAAQPFLRPALDNKEREALEAFSRSAKGKLP
jgi:HK97 gp10 family phage protein